MEKYREYLGQIRPTLEAVLRSDINLAPNLEMKLHCGHDGYTLMTSEVRGPLSLNWTDISGSLHPNAGDALQSSSLQHNSIPKSSPFQVI